MKKQCIQCKKEFIKPRTCSLTEWEKRKFCSLECKGKSQIGKAFFRPLGNKYKKGKKHTDDAIEKMRQAKFSNPVKYWLGKKRDEETKEKIRQKK